MNGKDQSVGTGWKDGRGSAGGASLKHKIEAGEIKEEVVWAVV